MIDKQLPKGALFDLDGVVVNSKSTHMKSWGDAYKDLFGGDVGEFPKELEGHSSPDIARYFSRQAGKPDQHQEYHDLKLKYVLENDQGDILLPGVKELTEFFREHKIPYGIASNASRDFVGHTIKQQGIDFDIFTGNEDYEKPKPAPEAYLKLAERLGFSKKDAQQLWIFEDSATGLKAASDSGMVAIGIRTHMSDEELKDAGAVMIFDTLYDVWQYLLEF